MATPLIRRRDLEFWLYEWLQAEQLYQQPRFAEHSRESVDAILDVSEQLATELFLTHYKGTDAHEPEFRTGGPHGEVVAVLPAVGAALRSFAQSGLFGAGFPTEIGGVGLPYLICSASFAQFAAANLATSAYVMLTVSNARLLTRFGTPAQILQFARPQIEGRWLGTMCLSESQAGSSLADIRTRAEAEGEDAFGVRYRLTGNKMWISAGDHDVTENIVHLVLAKIPGPTGALPASSKGISLFIVPKILPDGARNDIAVAGLNHKMGYRGIPNCLLNFGERDGAVGWRVGAAGDGLRQMFLMMNEARVSVGLGAAAVGYRGFRHSLQYALERRQGRAPGVRHGPPVALIEHADIRGMLLAQKAYAEGALALCLYCARLVDEGEAGGASKLLGLLTPVAKTWPSEYGLAANDLAIQLHGGYGYCREFDVEQLYRDNRLNAIHEGTTGIQAMDLVARKMLGDRGEALALATDRIAGCIAKARGRVALAPHAERLAAALSALQQVVTQLTRLPPERAIDNATTFLRAFGHLIVGWMWLEQALVAAARLAGTDSAITEREFYEGKIRACQYFFAYEVPRIGAWLEAMTNLSDIAAMMPAGSF